ncbi:hypothetical protein JCM10213v2_005225 [Rhodosporidiobolus nylandii]
MDPCELKDRLVVSAGEIDVLCVVHLLQRAEEVGSVGMLVDTEHSWNGLTALTAAASDDFSPTRKLVLELLLLCLEDKDPAQTGSYKRLKKKSGEEWAVKLIEEWRGGAKEKALDAQALLAVELPHVAAWVDTYLPKPLHPGAFTVCLSSIPAVLAPMVLHQQIRTLVTGLKEVQQKEPGHDDPIVVESLAPSHRQAPILKPPSSPPVASLRSLDLHATHPACPAPDIHALFSKLAIPVANLRTRQHRLLLSYYCTVPSRDASIRVRDALDGKEFEGVALVVERDPPVPHSSHPVVSVSGLAELGINGEPPIAILEGLARKTRSGTYGCRVLGEGMGEMRCPSPASAEDAVKMLDGMHTWEGTILAAQWRAGDGGKPAAFASSGGASRASLASVADPSSASLSRSASLNFDSGNASGIGTPPPAPPSQRSVSPSLPWLAAARTPAPDESSASPVATGSGSGSARVGGEERKRRGGEAEVDGRKGKRMKSE